MVKIYLILCKEEKLVQCSFGTGSFVNMRKRTGTKRTIKIYCYFFINVVKLQPKINITKGKTMRKKWKYYENENRQEAINLQQKYGLNSLIAEILANRGITNENAKIFLNPNRHDFHNPFQMPDMEKAVKRILQAIENNEKTIIFGDYDVDGITSSTVLKSFLKDRGLEVRKLYSK